MLMERRTLPSGSRQKEIQMHGRQRHLTWHNKKITLHKFDTGGDASSECGAIWKFHLGRVASAKSSVFFHCSRR